MHFSLCVCFRSESPGWHSSSTEVSETNNTLTCCFDSVLVRVSVVVVEFSFFIYFNWSIKILNIQVLQWLCIYTGKKSSNLRWLCSAVHYTVESHLSFATYNDPLLSNLHRILHMPWQILHLCSQYLTDTPKYHSRPLVNNPDMFNPVWKTATRW